MKRMKKMLLVAVALVCASMQASAQTSMKDAKDLVGVWTMESMQWEGEKKVMCGRESGYTQVKYYGADGEYACAELALSKEGEVVVMPHEYGTYSLKDGMYVEMGRPAIKDAVMMIDQNTTMGTWKTRHDIWKRQTSLPDKVVRYIVDCCKVKQTPADIKKQLKDKLFK